MARLRLFGPAREAAGVAAADVAGHSVEEVLAAATTRYGAKFGEVVTISRVWVNGVSATADAPVADADEVAVIPPVSGG
jgi:molybdopterin converting factor small subunit